MNIEDLTQAVEQIAKVHAFVSEHEGRLPRGLTYEAYVVWNKLGHELAEMKKAREEDQVKTDDLNRTTAQIVAESTRMKAVMAEAMARIDRIMAEYHDDIEEATK